MKKLFFSAVALVAFSGVSMGNTVEIKKKQIVEKLEKKQIKKNSDCHALSFTVYIASRDSGLSVAQSTANSNTAYWQCMGAALPKGIRS